MPEILDAASMARKGRLPSRTGEKSEVLCKLQGSIYFEKSLSASSASYHAKSSLVCAGRDQILDLIVTLNLSISVLLMTIVLLS
jgi:hypothetical protein